MKILISANAAWNIANFRSGLIRSLQAAGHEVVAAAPPDVGVERLAAIGCRFIPLAIDSQGASPTADASLTLRYARIIRRERPDVYLGYTVKPNVYGTLAARSLGVPAINNVSGLGTAFIHRTWLTPVVKRLYRTALASSSTVFFQNADDRDLFLYERLVRPEQARTVPGSGIDLARFAPAPPRTADGVTFLMVARLLWDKGVGEYVEAARRLRRERPDIACRLLGFLDVPNRTAVARADVEAWAAEGVVDYLGSVDDVRPFIADADCVVLPSYREGTPRTLLEAAAMARALIATDVPGCREPVKDGVNGFLCAVADSDDLADKMATFAAQPAAARAAMGHESRLIAEARYDERIVVQAYLDAIARATRTGPGRHGGSGAGLPAGRRKPPRHLGTPAVIPAGAT